MAPEGGSSFRQKTRFAKFTNVPEMLRMWHVSADIKAGQDLNLPAPALARRTADGQRAPETVVVQPCDALLAYVAELGERADKIRNRAVSLEEDNMLKVSGDGRRAALDLRLIGQPMTVPGKIGAAASRIAAIWEAHRDDTCSGAGGHGTQVRGSLQLVFCDLGTPGDGWNVYDELRSQLAARGLPRGAIRFVHEARTDRDKGELFAACRAGSVAVLIGSTEKMGVGSEDSECIAHVLLPGVAAWLAAAYHAGRARRCQAGPGRAYTGRAGRPTLMITLPGARAGRCARKAAGRSPSPKTAETAGRSRWPLTNAASSRSWPPSGLTTKYTPRTSSRPP